MAADTPVLVALGVLLAAGAVFSLVGLARVRKGRAWERPEDTAPEGPPPDLLATLSHELRAPLASIEAVAATLAGRWGDLSAQERVRLLERVSDNVRVMDELLTALLDVSRVREGRFPIEPEPVDLLEGARAVVERMGPALSSRVRIEGDPVTARVDRLAFDRVLSNLLSNAAKYSPRGSPITLTVRRGPEGAEVAVRDQGPGIDREELGKVFQRFYRSPRATGQGAGVGLALVRELVALHGGTVEVENAEPGARFRVVLPIETVEVRGQPAVR